MGLSRDVMLVACCLLLNCQSAMAQSGDNSPEPVAAESTAEPAEGQSGIKMVNEKLLPMINEAYTALGVNDTDKAIKALNKALVIDANSISARRYLAYALVRAHSYTSALTQMQELSKLTAPSPFDWYVFGDAYLGAGSVKHALTCYQQSLALSTNYVAARGGVVKCLAEMGYYNKAMEEVDKGNALATDKVVKKYYAALKSGVIDAELYRKETARYGSHVGVTQQQMAEVGSKPILINPSMQED